MELIEETGSMAAAGRAMGMSYRRAWMLVQEINGLFSEPVIVKHLGGAHGGGASLTSFGKEVVERFRRIERKLSDSAATDIEALQDAAKAGDDS
ncbi:MAG: LysR family transcriptional regulator [Rhodomicrobium sp.]